MVYSPVLLDNGNMDWKTFVVFSAVCASVPAAEVTVIEQIVAKVNGDIITRGELDASRRMIETQLRQEKAPPAKIQEILKQQEGEVLRDQIDTLLMVQKGKELSINVDPEVTRELADIQVQSKISDPDKFRAWVQEQAGMSYEDLKLQMKNKYLTQRVIRQEVGGRITIAKVEMLKYYEEHKDEFVRQEQVYLREILVSSAGKTPEQAAAAERRAKDILARAKKGEKFHELARDMSDSESAKNFGEIGWLKKDEILPALRDLFNQKKGYITDVMKVDNGFAIFKVEERHEAGLAPFEEVENEITGRLYEPRMQPKVREFLTRLREEAFLEIRAGYTDSGAAPGKDTSWKDPAQLKPETTTKEEVAARRRRRLLWVIPLKSAPVKPSSETPAQPAPPAAPELVRP